MKNPSRLLLALLAVAGSSAVLAQSSVTLYGRVNTTVERQKAGDNTTPRWWTTIPVSVFVAWRTWAVA